MRILVPLVMSGAIAPEAQPAPTASSIVRASEAGARLDSDLIKGGGTDDTVVLQQVLDRAKTGRGVFMIIDGPALVSGLNLYANTTLECTAGAGLFLKDESDRAVIRNVNRSRDRIHDKNIIVRGCFINGNREHQVSAPPSSISENGYNPRFVQEVDGTWKVGLQFFGVQDLTIEHVTIWGARSFATHIANAKHIRIRDVVVDSGMPLYPEDKSPDELLEYKKRYYTNSDGLHFNGPIQYLSIDGAKLRTGDDAIGLNANDGTADDLEKSNELGPYVGQGPITDVNIKNITFNNVSHGIRILSKDQRIDRISISNVTGTVIERMVMISRFISQRHDGNIGTVTLRDFDVTSRRCPPWALLQPGGDDPKIPADWRAFWEEEGEIPFFSINARIDKLVLERIKTHVIDNRPIIRLGARSKIRSMTADLSVEDPTGQAVPIRVIPEAAIQELSIRLHWTEGLQ